MPRVRVVQTLEIAHEQRERKFIKLTLGFLFGFIVFVLFCWGGCRFYSRWEQQHLVRRAAAYLTGGDLKQAALSAGRAWQMQSTADAARILAQISDRAGDRAAVEWRRQVLRLGSGAASDVLALVISALEFNDLPTAEQALQLVSPKEQDTGPFHAAAARVADAKHHPAEAEKQWQRATELAPQEQSFRLNWAISRLKSSDAAVHATGRAMLEELRNDQSHRAVATRALITNGAATHEPPETIRHWAKDLQSYPEHQFNDKLVYLSVLRQMQDPEFPSYLSAIEADAVANPTDLASLLSWMNSNGLSILAIEFARNLTAEQTDKWPVPLALAESYAKIADWPALERLTKSGGWGPFEFLRLAFLARAYRGSDKPVAAAHEWAEAQKLASAQAETLQALSRTITEWGWRADAIDLQWGLTKFPETQREALQTLYKRYSSDLDSQGLHRVMSRLAELEPQDLKVQNNFAQLSLLLGVDTDRARKLAAEIHRKDATNPAYISTYAYSLFSRGDTGEAVRIMQTLSDEDLHQPPIASYYGVFLAAAGEAEKAREFLRLANAAKLLPEEKKLVDQAKTRAGLL